MHVGYAEGYASDCEQGKLEGYNGFSMEEVILTRLRSFNCPSFSLQTSSFAVRLRDHIRL